MQIWFALSLLCKLQDGRCLRNYRSANVARFQMVKDDSVSCFSPALSYYDTTQDGRDSLARRT